MDGKFRRLLGYNVEISENVGGETLTSFKSGGRVKRLLKPADIGGLAETIYTLCALGEGFTVLGNGTNALVPDDGYGGNIVCLKRMKNLKVEDNYIHSSCGINVSTISLIARDNALTGMEFAIGIPGTLGGAIAMNAGAYQSEIGDKVANIDVLNGNSVETIDGRDLNFGYRDSDILRKRLIVLGAKLNLDFGDREEIQSTIKFYTERRRNTQPELPSAGSVFKRVDGKSAGYYIDRLNLKGKRIGAAMVSFEHANFIVNAGGASTSDYLALRDYIAEEVYNNFGFILESEVKIVGD